MPPFDQEVLHIPRDPALSPFTKSIIALGLGQTSLISCAERNANDLKSLFGLISIRFGA